MDINRKEVTIMMKYLCLFLFLLSYQLLADGVRIKSFDLNKDGIKDRFEYYQGKKLIRLEEDRNNDSKIDFITIFNDSTFYKIEKQDSTNTGKFDRVVSFKSIGKGKTRIQTKRDSNGDGQFDINFFKTVRSIQKEIDCQEDPQKLGEIDDLSTASYYAAAELNNGLLPTDFGYKIDKVCIEKWGNGFPEIVKDSIETGLKCLSDLAKNSPDKNNISGAAKNYKEIEQLLSKKKVSLLCSEEDYNWTGTRAHASASVNDKIKSLGIGHPFISINPKIPKMSKAATDVEISAMKKTIFHEQIHNLGYLHGHGVEYAYTCGACCFKDYGGDEGKKAACKVCTGNYKNASEKKYLEDIINFSKLTYNEGLGQEAVINYLKENPKSIYGMANLSKITSDVFNPIGYHLALLIESKNSNISKEDQLRLNQAKSRKPDDGNQAGEILANVYYQLYYEKNGDAAVSILDANKELLKNEYEKMEAKSEHTNYMVAELKETTYNFIFDMWVNRYGANPKVEANSNESVAAKAYKLHQFFE
ncbi:MAG: hypothetical protein ACJAT2_002226 [Bacteriovoracaceae bacterium]